MVKEIISQINGVINKIDKDRKNNTSSQISKIEIKILPNHRFYSMQLEDGDIRYWDAYVYNMEKSELRELRIPEGKFVQQ